MTSRSSMRIGNPVRQTNKWYPVLVSGLLVVLVPGQALARAKSKAASSQDKRVCVDAFNQARERAQSAHLREAKEMLGKCARAVCGSFLQQECTTLYTQLEAEIPSIVPVVTDDAGLPHALVELKMDGELLARTLDGHGIAVDPGKHEFSFATDAGVFAKKRIMIVQGQRNRPISVVLHVGGKKAVAVVSDSTPPEAATAKPEAALAEGAPSTETAEAKPTEAVPADSEGTVEHEVTQAEDTEEARPRVMVTKTVARRAQRTAGAGPGVLTYATAGVGLLGVTGYFLLSNWGRKDNNALNDCAAAGNLCPTASVNHIQKVYLAANITGAVGLAALATSAFLYYRSQTGEEVTSTRAAVIKHPGRTTVSLRAFDVQATPSGALATVGGAF